MTVTSAREKALYYLARFSRTERQVVDYLSRKGYSAQEITQTISYLNDRNFLNDRVFAESFIQAKIRRADGPMKIKFMLVKKGVNPKTIQELLNTLYPLELQQEKVKTLLRGLLRDPPSSVSLKAKEKIFRSVASRGFPLYVIIQSFKDLSTNK